MGNYLQSDMTWYIYRRALSTDEWVSTPLQCWKVSSSEDALAMFKHEVYSFVLRKHTEYEDTKSIYLYQGNIRIAKAHIDTESKQVEIWSTAIREWLASVEKLPPERYPVQEDPFFSKYLKRHAWVSSQAITFVYKS